MNQYQKYPKRQTLAETARLKKPNRWSGKIRDWSIENEVWLNPEKISSVDNYSAEKNIKNS